MKEEMIYHQQIFSDGGCEFRILLDAGGNFVRVEENLVELAYQQGCTNPTTDEFDQVAISESVARKLGL